MWMKIPRYDTTLQKKNQICMKCSMSLMEPKAIFSLVTSEKESLRSWPAPLLSLSSCIKTSRHKKRQSATLVPSSAWFSVAAGCSLNTWIIWHQLQVSLFQMAARGCKSDKAHWQTPNTMGPGHEEASQVTPVLVQA